MTDDVTFTHGGEGLLNLIWDYEIVKKFFFQNSFSLLSIKCTEKLLWYRYMFFNMNDVKS